jgi:hypothetical protein
MGGLLSSSSHRHPSSLGRQILKYQPRVRSILSLAFVPVLISPTLSVKRSIRIIKWPSQWHSWAEEKRRTFVPILGLRLHACSDPVQSFLISSIQLQI